MGESRISHRRSLILCLAAGSVGGLIGPACGAIIAGGTSHNLAVKSDGTVAAWGGNGNGQTSVPSGLTGVVAVAGGDAHSLALKSDGTAVGWGRSNFGVTTVPSYLNNIVAIAAGTIHSVVLRADGSVVAWGDNSSGQTNVPAGASSTVAIASGLYHILALQSSGTVVAWGANSDQQATVPTGLSNVVQVAAGSFHSLALKSDGTVSAWGYGGDGETTIPTGLNNVVSIASGAYHNLALKSDGTVVAWGYGGDGETTIPTGLSNVVAVSGAGYSSLALRSDGSVVTWGYSGNGQLAVPSGLTVATDANWSNAAGGQFLGGYNWKAGTPSTTGSNAVFALPNTYTVHVTTDSRAKSIQVSQGNVGFDLGGKTFRSDTTTTVAANSSLTLSSGTLQSSSVSVAGTLAGSGSITGNLINNGTTSPGSAATPIATLPITGNYSQSSGANLQMDLAGPSSCDKLTITGSSSLAGNLFVNLANGFTPGSGQTFDLFDFGSAPAGSFNTHMPALASGQHWNTARLYTTGEISVIGTIISLTSNGTGVGRGSVRVDQPTQPLTMPGNGYGSGYVSLSGGGSTLSAPLTLALQLVSDGQPGSESVATVLSDLIAGSGGAFTIDSNTAPGSTLAALNSSFGGNYNALLQYQPGSMPTGSSPSLSWDLGGTGVTLESVAAVPEPLGIMTFACLGVSLLMRRRMNQSGQRACSLVAG